MIGIARLTAARIARAGNVAPARPAVASPLLYLTAGLILRLMMFGKPAFQSDEQFYLLVGQRMAQGALPFVDIWDRKPYGLFLLYRSLFALPIDPVLAYQLAGLVFSVLTALVIERMARAIAPARAAQAAGLAYLLYQPVFNVALGQAPVFYNLPVALAALIVLRAMPRNRDARLVLRGCAAMLLLGLALQIKYSVVFEGVGFGMMLLLRGRRDGWGLLRLALTGPVWAGTALAPTLAVWAGYAAAGDGAAFVQANFLSIFGRAVDQADAFAQLAKEGLAMTPFALAILLAPRRHTLPGGTCPAMLPGMRVWALVAVLGFLVFGTWYDHYLGPVLVPLCLLSAPALAREARGERWYGRLLLGFGLLGALVVPALQVRERGTAADFAAASQAVARELRGRCLYVYEGDSALYRTTNACIPTRFAYPSHLNAMNEAGALGVDPEAEVGRILQSRPGVIVVSESSRPNLPNLRTRAQIRKALAHSYERYEGVIVGTRKFGLYRLKPAF
ncbi:hypothetical protein EDF57_10147 [Novosphingobium sp. PhB55]|uniref:hypothetical protein n=1 Tax=Novosphingobium sp. PhB55 TaxID=2485106 RepID=UPI0010669A18|nr:hypothetical protein [Novosphingobium sp. PhB55]TDW68175.1 hypothetical protein EDF57_10147 [Novosphingobium sp. PhB55]